MATSGTIGNTVISTDKIVEHAIRRCGKSPLDQSSETISIALDNLYLLVLALLNEGINLWLIQHDTIAVSQYNSQYTLPDGTVHLLNVQYSIPSLVTGTDSSDATSFQTELSSQTTLQAIGVNFSAITASSTIYLEQSVDGVVWTPIESITKTDWATSLTYWFRLSRLASNIFFRVRGSAAITVTSFLLASSVFDLVLSQYNRDDYLALSNKAMVGRPSTNYYFEKLMAPQITLWPVPNNDEDFISVAIQRQIQDVGSLSQEIEVPERWKELIIWQLAKRLAYELPGVAPERVALINSEIVAAIAQVNIGETDGAVMRITPLIGGYTR